jgi:hypothetical protein
VSEFTRAWARGARRILGHRRASIVYWEYRNCVASLMLVKSTGDAAPITLRQHVRDARAAGVVAGRAVDQLFTLRPVSNGA